MRGSRTRSRFVTGKVEFTPPLGYSKTDYHSNWRIVGENPNAIKALILGDLISRRRQQVCASGEGTAVPDDSLEQAASTVPCRVAFNDGSSPSGHERGTSSACRKSQEVDGAAKDQRHGAFWRRV